MSTHDDDQRREKSPPLPVPPLPLTVPPLPLTVSHPQPRTHAASGRAGSRTPTPELLLQASSQSSLGSVMTSSSSQFLHNLTRESSINTSSTTMHNSSAYSDSPRPFDIQELTNEEVGNIWHKLRECSFGDGELDSDDAYEILCLISSLVRADVTKTFDEVSENLMSQLGHEVVATIDEENLRHLVTEYSKMHMHSQVTDEDDAKLLLNSLPQAASASSDSDDGEESHAPASVIPLLGERSGRAPAATPEAGGSESSKQIATKSQDADKQLQRQIKSSKAHPDDALLLEVWSKHCVTIPNLYNFSHYRVPEIAFVW
jgi:hypothetical protein